MTRSFSFRSALYRRCCSSRCFAFSSNSACFSCSKRLRLDMTAAILSSVLTVGGDGAARRRGGEAPSVLFFGDPGAPAAVFSSISPSNACTTRSLIIWIFTVARPIVAVSRYMNAIFDSSTEMNLTMNFRLVLLSSTRLKNAIWPNASMYRLH